MTNGEIWRPASEAITLPPHTVQVWRANLDLEEKGLSQLARFLSEDERIRAARFRFERDRNHFVAARGLLRVILGRYLFLPPEQITFSYSERGKPYLAEGDLSALSFNVSHSHGLALYAFAASGRVGVDVEAVRPLEDAAQIAERFFSPAEVAEFRSLPVPQQLPGFFHCWTQKEAFIKAVGEGLSLPLDRFNVVVSPDRPAKLLRLDNELGMEGNWQLRSLSPAPGFRAAVAWEGTAEIQLFDGATLDFPAT